MKKLFSLFPILLFAFLSINVSLATPVPASQTNPVQVLEDASSKMLHALRKHNKEIKHDYNFLFKIVEKILLPYVDLHGMSRSVLGRAVWNKITPEERKEFGKEFTKLIVRTYSVAMSSYTDEKVKFYPLRGGYENRSRVQVYSVIERQNGPNIAVNYRVVQLNGEWKVYDFSVEGVSMIRSFQSQFAQQLAEQRFSKVLQTLMNHNRKNG